MMKKVILTCAGLTPGILSASSYPYAELANGQITARLALPDAHTGFYRGTRFDWSGMVVSLKYQGHEFYGPWFDRVDPQVRDFEYVGAEIVAGQCSAATGPAEEFQTQGSALGWDEAKAGGTFIKIGVGVLRKDAAAYSFAKLYEILDPGQWTVRRQPDAVEFTHELGDPATGYRYLYWKRVRLTPDRPELVLEHRLKNTGTRTIPSAVYNHNFLVLDREPPGPDFRITLPYAVQTPRLPPKELAAIRENRIVYLKALAGQELVQTPLLGFSERSSDYDIRIENAKLGVGLRITGDRPLSHHALWSIRSVLSFEPFIALNVPPGSEFAWKVTYEYYSVPRR
jgi:hypothetical protein